MNFALELSANLVVTISILLAGRNSVHTWWTGIIGCLLFGMLFYSAQLYADVVLQLFFVVTSLIGWWQWKCGDNGLPRPIENISKSALLKIVPLGCVVALSYGFLLHIFTNAYAPFIDSGVLVFSVIAQILMMKRYIECWFFWLIVNTVAVPLFMSRGLYLTGALYICYWINAFVAYKYWMGYMNSSRSSESIGDVNLSNEAS